MKKTAIFICIGLCMSLASTTGLTKTARDSAYRYDQIWSTSVRFLRVDSGFQIIEQDKGTGYVMFEYQDAGRVLTGSLELIPKERGGSEFVTVSLHIQDMPSYVEVMLIDKLVRKLRNEYGEPRVLKTAFEAEAQIKKTTKAAETDNENEASNSSDDKIEK